MEKRRCLMLLYAEIRQNEKLATAASAPWRREYYREMAEALTLAANAVNGKGGGVWSRLATRCGLYLHRAWSPTRPAEKDGR